MWISLILEIWARTTLYLYYKGFFLLNQAFLTFSCQFLLFLRVDKFGFGLCEPAAPSSDVEATVVLNSVSTN